MAFLCRIGWHRWNPEVPVEDRELIRSTGLHIIFASSGIQKGVQRCLHCPATRKVYRIGMVSMALFPSQTGKWKPCSAAKEREIDSYPVL